MLDQREKLCIDGVYDSTFTHCVAGTPVLVSDIITLTTDTLGTIIIGTGERGRDGLQMYLFLGATSLAGVWEECDKADEPDFAGHVEFTVQAGRLVGYWCLFAGNNTVQQNGIWILSRRIESPF